MPAEWRAAPRQPPSAPDAAGRGSLAKLSPTASSSMTARMRKPIERVFKRFFLLRGRKAHRVSIAARASSSTPAQPSLSF